MLVSISIMVASQNYTGHAVIHESYDWLPLWLMEAADAELGDTGRFPWHPSAPESDLMTSLFILRSCAPIILSQWAHTQMAILSSAHHADPTMLLLPALLPLLHFRS